MLEGKEGVCVLNIYNAYKKAIKAMNKALDVIIVILMLSMVGVVIYQVIMRQIFENPPMWGEQIAVLLMIWFVFLGIVLGLEEGLHIGITLLVSRLPKKAAYIVEIIVNVLILVLATLFILFGAEHVATLLRTGAVMPVTGLPNAIFYLPIALTGALMVLVTLGKIAEQIIQRKELLA